MVPQTNPDHPHRQRHVLNACNTVRGIGRDVESVGKTVKKVPD